jgi:hypothetical protein
MYANKNEGEIALPSKNAKRNCPKKGISKIKEKDRGGESN